MRPRPELLASCLAWVLVLAASVAVADDEGALAGGGAASKGPSSSSEPAAGADPADATKIPSPPSKPKSLKNIAIWSGCSFVWPK